MLIALSYPHISIPTDLHSNVRPSLSCSILQPIFLGLALSISLPLSFILLKHLTNFLSPHQNVISMRSGLLISRDHYAKKSALHIVVSFFKLFIYLFIFGFPESLWLWWAFSRRGEWGPLLSRAWPSHCRGFSLCSRGSRSAGSNSCGSRA